MFISYLYRNEYIVDCQRSVQRPLQQRRVHVYRFNVQKMGDLAERTSGLSEADECGHCSRKHRTSDGVDERTGWRFGETQHGVWGRYQLGRIKDHREREWTNTEEEARRSGDDQTDGIGEEGVEPLQPDGTVAVDDILVST